MKMTHLSKTLTVLALGGALLAVGMAATLTGEALEPKDSKGTTVSVAVDERPLVRDSRMNASFAPVVKKVGPSVVKVFTTTKMKPRQQMEGIPFDDPFFRHFFGGDGRRGQLNVPPQHGIGSGVIVTKDGYILTNNHVVEDADELKVALQDGREFTAKVVGKDPKADVAVIKIEATDLPRLDMTDSDKLEVGDVVLAIGNPFGIGQTVTMGIISATGRATMGLDYEDFIQTDAAINPGNSGGALVDTEGRLIGINTAIFSRSGGNQGIGFAIPTNLARDVMDKLIKYGKVTRGYLGVLIQDVTPALAKEFNLKDEKGALIGDVVSKSPAEKAGLKNGDVILQFNGKAVSDSRKLKLEVARVKPGESVPVKIMRSGATKTLDVTVKELPDQDNKAENDSEKADTSDTLQGVSVTDLDTQARQELSVPGSVQGAVVTGVDPGSAAAEAGLKPGDVITEINRKPVRSADDAVKLTENAQNKNTLLRVWSKGGTRYVVVNEGKGK